MSENKRVTIPFLEKVLKPIVDLVKTKADKNNVYTKEDLAKVATSGSYTDLTNAPTLAAVATSGAYADLSGAPELAAVATSGSYEDLSDVPVPDATLSVEGSAADAKATGDAVELAWAKAEITHYCPDIVLDPDVNILYDPEKTEVGQQEYFANTDIEVVYLPNVETIGEMGFGDTAINNTTLKAVIVPSLKRIGKNAFRRKKGLRYVYAPKCDYIDGAAFYECASLEKVDFPGISSFENTYGVPFQSCTMLMEASFENCTQINTNRAFAQCTSLKNVNFPKLATLGSNADGVFYVCSALERVDFPALQNITATMFNRCAALTTVILRSETLCTLANVNAFTGTPVASGTGYIYVPAALIEDYKTAANWSTYAAQFRAIEDYPEICGEINLTVSMLDDTLSVEGAPADAKAVGDALAETGVWYVHATANDDGSFTLDKTYDEIMAAYNAGRKVQCEMRFTADAGAGAYIFDLVTFGPYVPDVHDGDTVYNGALFVLWMQNRMMRMLVTTDNQVMIFETNKFLTYGELQIRYGNELMYAGHMGVDVDIDLNIPINAPKDYVAFTDQVNGYIYYVSMRNGTLVSTCAIETIEVASMPTTVEYTAGDAFDPSGLTIMTTRYDGTTAEVTDFTYDAPETLTEDVTAIPVTYTDMGVAYTVDVPITVNPFDPEVILVDFEYTDNGDGTYTITGWKGTYNGEASTEMIIPNYSCIIV